MRYGSVCSGIEAATMAWHPLGWTPAFFSEIEAFPSAVLAHHYGSNMPGEPLAKNGIPNYGDFTQIRADAGPIDLLVGGTPCQSFSVAGKRLGLDDPRGNLALEYLSLARRLRARWIVWENVPGVVSSVTDEEDGEGGVQPGLEGREAGDEWIEESDFATFLSFVRECGYGFAYRVLDAQYVRVDGFGRAVPQRRRRVFLVGYLGDWRRAAAVLLEPQGMRGDSAPRREPRQSLTRSTDGGSLSRSVVGGVDYENNGHEANEPTGPLLKGSPTGGGRPLPAVAEMITSTGNVAHCLNAGGMGRQDFESETMVAHPLLAKGNDSHDESKETYIVFDTTQITSAANYSCPKVGDPCHPLASGAHPPAVAHTLKASGFDASEDGTGRGTPIIPVHAIQAGALRTNPSSGPDGVGVQENISYTLEARAEVQAVAFDMRGREGGAQFEGPHDTANIRAASGGSSKSYVAQEWAVRRLTPTECERLQGFPDNFTNVPWGKKETSPDGPRYKALGNSMAVNAMRWIGRRIEMVEQITKENAA